MQFVACADSLPLREVGLECQVWWAGGDDRTHPPNSNHSAARRAPSRVGWAADGEGTNCRSGTSNRSMRMRWQSVAGVIILGCMPLLSGCLGDGSAGSASHRIGSSPVLPQQPPTLRIQIRETAYNGNRGALIQSWTLGCSPPSGTKPRPEAACRALRDYVRNLPGSPFACSCPAARIGTPYAVIKGTLDGKPFRAALTNCTCLSGRLVRDLYIGTGLADAIHS